MRRSGVDAAQQDAEAFGQRGVVTGRAIGFEVVERVEHLHRTRDDGVVLHALVVVVHLLEHGVHFQAQRLGRLGERQLAHAGGQRAQVRRGRELVAEAPDTTQEAVAAFHRRVVPLQRGLGRRGEHGVQARGVGAVLLDQILRIDTVVLGLGHGAHALVVDRRAHRQVAHGLDQLGADDLAGLVKHVFHVLRPEVVLATLLGAARVDVVEHHALGQQLAEGLVDLHEAEVAHDLGPEARVQQVQDGVFDAADVLVHRHPVVGAFGDHLLAVGGIAIAHEVPGRIHESVHGVGLAPRGFTAHRADHASVEAFVLVQRVARAVGYAVLRQHHRQVLLRHRHRAVFVTVDDGNGCAPVALATHTPVAQAEGGLLLAQTLGGQQLGDLVHGGLLGQAIEHAGVDAHAALLVGVAVGPDFVGERLTVHRNHLLDRQLVLERKREVALVVRRHAHHGAVAVAHEHVVADPDLDLRASQRVRDEQAGGHAFLFLRGELGFGGAAGLAFFDEDGQRRVGQSSVVGQRVLGCHGAEGHAHDGVGPRGEHVHPAVADQRAVSALDRVREREANALALADPVLLHQPHLVGPAVERGLGVAQLHMVEQLVGVRRDVQVVAGDFALFHRGACAPALAVDHLLIGQNGLVHRVPVDDLGLAVSNAFFQHLQEQPLVPLVITGVARGHLTRPVDGQPHRLHLLLHVGDVFIRPLGRRHTILQRRVLGRQAERVPAHGHEHVVTVHAQVTREHVVDGVVAHMAHVQLAAGVGQHGTGVELLLACVFAHAVGVGGVPVGVRGALDILVGVFFLHETGRQGA